VEEKALSISYDDGNNWLTLDKFNRTCVEMISPVHGYSGGFTTGKGNNGVFVYQPLQGHLPVK
jgi:hypothetical protein